MNEENFLGKNLRVAFIHDWLVTYRGGEKVLESIGKLFPTAPIYTLFYDPSQIPPSLRQRDIRYPKTLNYLKKFRKPLLPFLPSLIESIDLRGYDLIISTSSCVAKGVIPSVEAKHLCYIHSPMRYIWDQRGEYFQNIENIPVISNLLALMLSRLRVWDVVSSHRVDSFVANSHFIKKRVEKFYRREANVVHPPVSLDSFYPKNKEFSKKDNFFLAAGALVPYKRFDLAIQACKELGVKLVVAGAGPSEGYLRSLGDENIEFIRSPDQNLWVNLMQKAKALLFPGVEDFGIIPIEAMASGTPVIAYKSGGVLDYLEEGKNAKFFEEQSKDSLIQALSHFSLKDFDAETIIKSTERFSEERFLREFSQEINRLIGV